MKNLKTTVKNLVLVGLLGMTLTSCYKKKYNEEVRLNQALVETVITLESKLSALKINVLDAEDQLELNVTLIEALEGNNQHLYDVNLELWDLINKLNNDITILSAEFEASNQESNNKLETKIIQLNAALAEVQVLTNTIDGLNTEILRLTNIINNFRSENTVYITQINDLTRTIAELRNASSTIEYVTVDRVVEIQVPGPTRTVTETVNVNVYLDGETITVTETIEIEVPGPTITEYSTETVTETIDNTDYVRIAQLEAELAALNATIMAFIDNVLPQDANITGNNGVYTKTRPIAEIPQSWAPGVSYIYSDLIFNTDNMTVSFVLINGYTQTNTVRTFDNNLDAALFMVSTEKWSVYNN